MRGTRIDLIWGFRVKPFALSAVQSNSVRWVTSIFLNQLGVSHTLVMSVQGDIAKFFNYKESAAGSIGHAWWSLLLSFSSQVFKDPTKSLFCYNFLEHDKFQ